MKKPKHIKNALLASILTISLFACKKKEETPEPTTPVASAAPCFNSQYNGTYTGSGFSAAGNYTLGTLSITKSGCQSLTLILNTNIGYNFNDNITQLVLNGQGGYDGKQSNGNAITVALGSMLSVKAVGSFTFSGSK